MIPCCKIHVTRGRKERPAAAALLEPVISVSAGYGFFTWPENLKHAVFRSETIHTGKELDAWICFELRKSRWVVLVLLVLVELLASLKALCTTIAACLQY